MDPEVAVDQNAAVEPSQDVGAKKRGIQNGEFSASKKQRCCGGLKRVAEIVLVLSATGKMRGGGKSPTSAETALMAEARETLAAMCEEVAVPKDIVGSEAIVNAIEELGLNSKLKEQRLGFRGMGMSISQKVFLAKMKMEEPKKFSAPATYASQSSLQTGVGKLAENRGASHAGRILPSDRPIHATVTAAGSTPLQNQIPTSDVKMTTMSTGMPSGHLGRDSSSFAYPRVDRPQIKLDVGSNATSYVSQVPTNSAASHPHMNAPNWSLQAQPAALAKPGQENKVLTHNPIKVEGSSGSTMAQMTPQAARDQTFRPFVTQTATGTFPSVHQPVQGVNFTQTPPFNNHNEIARIVQNLLQPKLPAHPTWTPPSRDYMNKAMTCQTCKLTINEVETVLICDACEKGSHLKCLQLNNKKGIPRGEWHCARCLSFSNGKPPPPKYGRVMRSINVPKVPSSTAEAQSSSEKKVENLGPAVNHEKVAANGSSGLQTPAMAATVDSNPVESASASMAPKGNLETFLKGDTPSPGTVNERREEHFQMIESTNHEERKDPTSTSQLADTSYTTISNKADDSQPSHEEYSQMTESSNHEEIKDPTSTSQLADASYNTISDKVDDSQPSHEEHSQMTESTNHEERKDPTSTSQLADTSCNTISNKADDSQPSHEEYSQMTESSNHEEIKDPTSTSQLADASYNTISDKVDDSQPSHEEHSQMTESTNHEERKDPTSTSQLADTSYNTISHKADDSQPSHEEHAQMTESSNHEEIKDPTSTSQLADASYNTISDKVDDSQPSHEEHSQMTESSNHEERKDPASTSQLADTSYNTISNKVDDSQPSHEEHSQMTESSTCEERKDLTSTSQLADTSYNTINKVDDSQLSHDSQYTLTEQQNCAEVPSNNFHDESSGVTDLGKGCSKGDIDCIKQSDLSEQDAVAAEVDPTGNSRVNTEISRHPEFSSDGLRAVEWAGDVLQIADGKKFYQSCCIDGINYKVHDHALVHFGQDKLIPSKLQAMWEDAKTGSKWVVIKRCYFPNDLPEGVAHPCAPEIREVYESNNDSTVMASSIQCPCEVLPADKFKEESERRSQLGIEANEGLIAIFLCGWLYDECKGSFQPISS